MVTIVEATTWGSMELAKGFLEDIRYERIAKEFANIKPYQSLPKSQHALMLLLFLQATIPLHLSSQAA